MNKRYYWLKLKDDFFNGDDIKLILKKENGPEYIIFWQRLLLKAITSKEVGILRYKDNIPYNPEILSTVMDTNIDIVKGALTLFEKLGMIDLSDTGDIIIDELIQELIGTETDVAKRVRKHRKKKVLLSNKMKQIGNTEKELKKDLKKIESKIYIYRSKLDLFNYWNDNISIYGKIPKVLSINDDRYKKYKKRIQEGLNFDLLIQAIKESQFIQGENDKGWCVSFDWIFENSTNWLKVTEGKYKDKKTKPKQYKGDITDFDKYSKDNPPEGEPSQELNWGK